MKSHGVEEYLMWKSTQAVLLRRKQKITEKHIQYDSFVVKKNLY